MVAFLRWSKSIGLSVLNGIAKFVVFLVLVTAVLIAIAMFQGDGLQETWFWRSTCAVRSRIPPT